MKQYMKTVVKGPTFTTSPDRGMGYVGLLTTKIKFCAAAMLVAIASLAVTPAVFADEGPTATLIQTLVSTDPNGNPDPVQPLTFYGMTLAHTDQWLAVAAPIEFFFGEGKVYLYKRLPAGGVDPNPIKLSGEGLSQTFGDRFGAGLAMMGNTLFVAAVNTETDFAGKVYVYNYNATSNAWELTQEIIGPNLSIYQAFGARSYNGHMELFAFGGHSEPTIALIGAFNGVDTNSDGLQDAFDAKMYAY